MKVFLIILLLTLIYSLQAAYFSSLETTVEQPDGTQLHLFASGDEFYNWLHDAAGFTIIQSETDGFYYYAQRSGEILVPSIHKALSIDPKAAGIEPGLKFSDSYIRNRIEMMSIPQRNDVRPLSRNTLNNLAVYISFSDQNEFSEPRSYFDQKFNDTDPDSISLRGYYNEISYNQLELVTYHFPESPQEISISYQDPHPRGYFLPYNQVTNPDGYQYFERTEREHQLLADAIEFIADEVSEDIDIDYNDDGYVDNVCFIIRGVHSAWADLLWAHRWALYSNNAFINGLQVWDYTFQPENQNTVRVLAHEMFHALGAPDLYHYNFDGISPAGPWDVMESGFVHMGAHMKYKYGGWIEEIPEITETGWYQLNPLNMEDNNCYKIASPNSTNEYFVLEYRKRDPDSYDRNVPGSGLLVYRIKDGINGNADGPPDEVYVYREGGTTNSNGSIVKANFCLDESRTDINDNTDPSSFLTTGNSGGLNLSGVSLAEETITFYVDLNLTNVPPNLQIVQPGEDTILPLEDITISIEVEDMYNNIVNVDLYIDDTYITSFTQQPYEFLWEMDETQLGEHNIFVSAVNDLGFSSQDEVNVNVIDPALDNWFTWYTQDPDYLSWGRGCIPIQVAVDFNLGDIDYYIKQVSLNIEQDPYGSAPEPGLVHCEIVELDDDGITDNVLYEVGSFTTPMEGRYYHDVYSDVTISGRIAVIMDISSYQNILFDQAGTTGHSWITETDRPWVDALSRGVFGAADIGIMLSTDPTFSEEDIIPGTSTILSNYPNPFNPATTISFNLNSENIEETELSIYNMKGQRIKTISSFESSNSDNSNRYSVIWDGTDETGKAIPSGIYFCQLNTGSKKFSQKMLLLK